MAAPIDHPRPDSAAIGRLLEQAAAGDPSAVGELMAHHRSALREFVDLHLYPAVRGRVDASDVVQEAQAEMTRRMSEFLSQRPMPFHLWAKKITYDHLIDVHRRHVYRASRTVLREEKGTDRSSYLIARPLLAACPSPSQEAARRETAEHVNRAIASLPEADREILLLRHADRMPFAEIGSLLGIESAAARKRFGRALLRLRKLLGDVGLL
jgi:RNA polymerase sigma-70 factor, ECF subfamily